MTFQGWIRRGLLNDVPEIPVNDGDRGRRHDGYFLHGSIPLDDRGYGHRDIAIGMYVPVKSREIQPVEVRELIDLAQERLLVCQIAGQRGPRKSKREQDSDEGMTPAAHLPIEEEPTIPGN